MPGPSKRVVWPAEAVAWAKAQPSDSSIRFICSGLRQFFAKPPAWSTVRAWLRENAPRTKDAGGVKYGDWLNDETHELLREGWAEGLSLSRLASAVSDVSEFTPSDKTIRRYCLNVFGPRPAPTLVMQSEVQVETRTRRCCRCRVVVTLPRYVFTCDSCARMAPAIGAPDGVSLVGVRMR